MFLWREGASVMPILGGWGEGKDAVFYQQGRGWVLFPSCLIFCRINSTLRYYLMNHPEKFVQGYSVMTTQYRYTEYVGLTEWVSNKPLHPQTQNMRISIRATSAETEEQQPNWGDVHDWGELYDLEADPQVLRTLWKEWDSCQENFNLYRDHDYLDLKVQMRKLLHAGWYDHN